MGNKRPSEYIKSWMGAKQGDATHKFIIDTYNEIKPLPSGYKMNTSVAWCAATVSAAYHLAGLDNYFPSECSCGRMIEKAKKMGIWIEDDKHVPKTDDVIIYAWNDDKNTFGSYDNNTGHDHTGIVTECNSNIIYVYEGNKSKQVGVRTLPVNGRYIRGFISPKIPDGYYSDTKLKSNEEIAKEVIAGKWGNNPIRKQKLIEAGYNYDAIRDIVNSMYKGTYK